MIRVLRRRFLTIAMLSLTGTLCMIGFAINLGNYYRITKRVDLVIELLYQNDGTFPLSEGISPDVAGGFQVTEEMPFETKYCLVRLNEDGQVTNVDIEHIAALDREKIEPLVSEIVKEDKTAGYRGYYRYHVYDREGERVILFLDSFLQLQSFYNVIQVTIVVFLCCVGALELTKGKDSWTESTNNQVKRMDSLIHDLIELAKSEEAFIESGDFTGRTAPAQGAGADMESGCPPPGRWQKDIGGRSARPAITEKLFLRRFFPGDRGVHKMFRKILQIQGVSRIFF